MEYLQLATNKTWNKTWNGQENKTLPDAEHKTLRKRETSTKQTQDTRKLNSTSTRVKKAQAAIAISAASPVMRLRIIVATRKSQTLEVSTGS
jgi:hypothetical protein